MERPGPAQANSTRFQWNHLHRLSKVTLPDLSTAEYRYNADELRTWRREPSGAETHSDWVPDEVLELSQVLNELDGTGARKADYVLGPDGRIAILDGDENERYDLFDALGSVLAVGGPRMGSGSVFEEDRALKTVSGNEQGTPGRWTCPPARPESRGLKGPPGRRWKRAAPPEPGRDFRCSTSQTPLPGGPLPCP